MQGITDTEAPAQAGPNDATGDNVIALLLQVSATGPQIHKEQSNSSHPSQQNHACQELQERSRTEIPTLKQFLLFAGPII